ncbi:MAG TPA: CdaR family protein [Thermomicrobiales bacterium]|nr:CdaR family protein [Thermomicrobiales bacterium]
MINTIGEILPRMVPHPSSDSLLRLGLSCAIAIVLWGWVSTVGDPEETRVFRDVPVQVDTLSGNLDVVTLPPPATVRVTGAESVVSDIDRSEIQAELDLREVNRAGTYEVPVRVSLDHDVRRVLAEPREVSIVVQETVSEIETVQYIPPDDVEGTKQIGALEPEVTEVTVTGSRSVMDTIDRVIVPIDTGDRTSTFTGEFRPIAVTSDGVQVNDVAILPDEIEVRVPISTRGKTVPVLVNVAGEPAAGFEEVYRTSNPPTVVIDGPADVLAQIPFVSTTPVDISGETGSVQNTVEITGLPDGISVLVPQSGLINAVVQIDPRGSRIVLEDQPVQAIGARDGQLVEITPAFVDVELLAEGESVEQVAPDSVMVIADVSGLGPGVHQVRPRVLLPPNMEWISITPATARVTIKDNEASRPPTEQRRRERTELPAPPFSS